jgi:hypothetical protein
MSGYKLVKVQLGTKGGAVRFTNKKKRKDYRKGPENQGREKKGGGFLDPKISVQRRTKYPLPSRI